MLRRLESDGLDLNLSIGLSVALTSSVALLGLILEDVNLLALAVLNDLGGNLGALNNGGTESGGFVTYNCENLVKGINSNSTWG